jgi:hypothetical protein
MFVNYEDFCRDPNKIRNDIARFTGTQLPDKPIHSISPYKYHTIQGNPMRLKKEDLKIRYDERWKERLTDTEKKWLDRISNKKSKINKHF